jgi:hypothetical protein
MKDVDGRDKPGHDEGRVESQAYVGLSQPTTRVDHGQRV